MGYFTGICPFGVGNAQTSLRFIENMLIIPESLKNAFEHPVAILGGGVSGKAAAELVEKCGGSSIIYDESSENAVFGREEAAKSRLLIFSPGFRPDHKWLLSAKHSGCLCLGEIDFASLFWRGSVLAVTGTNGKTTLTEFLVHALLRLGKDAAVAGNIGVPLSRLTVERDGGGPESIAVCEVSSFQAETLQYFRADSAIWTNFAEDHLERHPDMQAYFKAKMRLLERSLGGEVLVGSSVRRYAESAGQALPEASLVETEGQSGDILLQGTVFENYPQRENFLLAAAWWRSKALPEMELYEAARDFRLSDHRLSLVDIVNGVEYWNDSKATNFHAVEAALANFQRPVFLIAGGKAKGGDLHGFIRRIKAPVKELLLIGATAEELAAYCREEKIPFSFCGTLTEAVKYASKKATDGDYVVLSPGFASFDQFKGYSDRGAQFIALVKSLKQA